MQDAIPERNDIAAKMSGAMDAAYIAIRTGKGLAELSQMDPKKLEALYAVGHARYVKGDYAGAEASFGYLARVETPAPRTLKGLAAARKMQGDYEGALKAYAVATALDMEDPEPAFFSAECLFHMHEPVRARMALELARDQAEERGSDAPLLKKIEEMISLLPDTPEMRAAEAEIKALDEDENNDSPDTDTDNHAEGDA